MGEPVKVGIVGCGKISEQYTQTLTKLPVWSCTPSRTSTRPVPWPPPPKRAHAR